MYLGELNPRVTGASSITNVTAVAYGDMPLFLFHLLEFMDVDYEIDVDELNERWAQPGNLDEWTQFILKQTEDVDGADHGGAASGIWRMDGDRGIAFARRDTDWHTVADEIRGLLPAHRRRAGSTATRAPTSASWSRAAGSWTTSTSCSTARRDWITGIKGQFASVPPRAERAAAGQARAVRLQDALSPVRYRLEPFAPYPANISRTCDAPVHVPCGRGARPRPEVAGGLRGAVAALPRRGSCGRARRRGPPTPRACACCARTCRS